MRIGFTCSTFDLFHAGHVLMLKEAKTQCDYLIVGLQSDPTIDRPKEKNKPVQSLFERFVQLQSCKYVDQVIPYTTEKELVQLLLSFPIDVRILGKEYETKMFTGRDECIEKGIELYFNSREHEFSTTELRERVLRSKNATTDRTRSNK
jgi:glycerol-3-phosphate cytidylyltransferase